MKYILIVLFTVPCSLFGQDSTSLDNLELEKLNDFIFSEYILSHNVAPLEEYASDDFVLVAAPGILETKAQVMHDVQNLNISSLKIMSDTILMHGDVGVVIGVLQMEGTILGRPVPNKIRYSSTFVREENEWKLIARTMTAIRM